MKKLYQCLFLLGALVLAGSLWSCSDDDDNLGTNGGDTGLGVEAPASDAVFATSATFKLKTKGAESYVCKVVEGAKAPEPDPIIAYAEAEENGEVVAVEGETAEETVAGLEGNKTYTVFFIFKVGDKYEILSQEITTPQYSQMVTVVKTDMFSVTLHVEVPEDVYYSLSFLPIEDYESFKEYGTTDVDYITASPYGGMKNPRFKGPRNITIANGAGMYVGAVNEKDDKEGAYQYVVHPGTGYVAFVGQCAEDGATAEYENRLENEGGDDDWGVLRAELPNIKEYTEEKPSNDLLEFTGRYAKTVLFSKEPKQGTGNVLVNIDRITEKSVWISFTPSDDILQYIFLLSSDEDRELVYKYVGGEDGWQAYVLNGGNVADSPEQGFFDLKPGVNYSLSVVGICSEDGSVQTFQEIKDIKAIVSDKPAVELKVTPLTMESPYQIGYNIKAPNGDCAAFKYILNYTKEWYPMLNQLEGSTLESNIASMMASYGQVINDAEVLREVNGSEGYNMYFSSMDDTESWLILESYNEDEKTKLFYDGDDYKVKTLLPLAEEPVDSELFEKLQGTWTAKMSRVLGEGVTEEDALVTMPVTIAATPEVVTTLPEDVKAALIQYYMEQMNYTEEKANKAVADYFEEYKERTDYYTQKYKNMNCLVATGFSYNEYTSPLATSWDLFKSTEYSAFSTDELFRDYGPKLFLQIGKDEEGKDIVTVISTRYADDGYNYARYVDPVSDWYRALKILAFNAEIATNFYIADFPVEISEDMKTIIIKPAEQEGKMYSPSFAVEYAEGYPSWDFQTDLTGIVLTRTDEAAQLQVTRGISAVTPKVSARSGNHFRRTCAPYGYTVKTPIQGEVFSIDRMKKNLKK